MKRLGYADRNLLFYPGSNLSDEEKRRMDVYDIGIEDVTVDHIVYSMSRQIENNFQTFYSTLEEMVGEQRTLEIALQIGRKYGGVGYRNLLESLGRQGAGSPETMAIYQDLVHAIRGPKHIAALYAEYDEKRCVVKRRACVYYSESQPENGKYVEAFERGCLDGYCAEDSNLKRVDVKVCLCRGNDHCETHFVYED